MRAVATLALVLACTGAYAAAVGGRLGTGRPGAPALRVYAWAPANGRLYSQAGGTATSYRIELPPGRYWLFAGLDGSGAPPIYAAYTLFTRCTRAPRAANAAECDRHEIAEVEVGRRRLADIDLTDWALADESANAIDGVLGRPPGEPYDESGRAAPKFSEYPARAVGPPPEAPVEPHGARTEDREAISAAIAQPASFAGHFVLVPLSCATACGGAALLDVRSGTVFYPHALNPLPPPPACEPRTALTYRRDSRLLIVRSTGTGGAAETRYYTAEGDGGELKLVTSRPGDEPGLAAHCAGERGAHGTR